MTVYDVGDGFCAPPSLAQFLYVRERRLLVEALSEKVELASGEGRFLRDGTSLTGGGLGWLYEVAEDAPLPHSFAASTIVLSRPLIMDTRAAWMVRVDRVHMPVGFSTPRHGHRGPGIRRLITGRILAEIAGEFDRIEAGQAWFERGPDPVVGRNLSDNPSVFVRMMLLPGDLLGGKSSFVPAGPEEASKPRGVALDVLGESRIAVTRSGAN